MLRFCLPGSFVDVVGYGSIVVIVVIVVLIALRIIILGIIIEENVIFLEASPLTPAHNHPLHNSPHPCNPLTHPPLQNTDRKARLIISTPRNKIPQKTHETR